MFLARNQYGTNLKEQPKMNVSKIAGCLAGTLLASSAYGQTAPQLFGVWDSHKQFVGTSTSAGELTRTQNGTPTTMSWNHDGFLNYVVLWYTDGNCTTTPYIDAEMPPAPSYWYGTPTAIFAPTSAVAQEITVASQYYYENDGSGVQVQCAGGFSITTPMVPASQQTIKAFYPPFCAAPNGTTPSCK
jgi:hypothetical protein